MKTAYAHLDLEKQLWEQDFHIIGIDEVGRGPLAGPVTVGGVCFSSKDSDKLLTLGIRDSKKLPEHKRLELSKIIASKASAYSVVSSDVEHINTYGIVNAIQTATRQVVGNILTSLKNPKPIFLLLDYMSFFDIPSIQKEHMKFIVKGDSISVSIASASIIAKVYRDNYMSELSEKFPAYSWNKNKGYATADHREAIKKYNISPFHRLLFVRNFSTKI